MIENTKEAILNRNNSPRAVWAKFLKYIVEIIKEDSFISWGFRKINKNEALNTFKNKFDDFMDINY